MPTALLRPLTTEAEVRAELGNKDAAIQEKVLVAINAASRALERCTGRQWGIYDFTAAPLNGYINVGMWQTDAAGLASLLDTELLVDGPDLYLPLGPVLSVTSITEADVLLVEGTDYLVDRPRAIIRRLGTRARSILENVEDIAGATWRNRLVFVGKLGYDNSADPAAPAPELPGDLRTAATKMAAAWSGENRREQVTFDGRRLPYVDKAVPRDAWELLRPYIKSNV